VPGFPHGRGAVTTEGPRDPDASRLVGGCWRTPSAATFSGRMPLCVKLPGSIAAPSTSSETAGLTGKTPAELDWRSDDPLSLHQLATHGRSQCPGGSRTRALTGAGPAPSALESTRASWWPGHPLAEPARPARRPRRKPSPPARVAQQSSGLAGRARHQLGQSARTCRWTRREPVPAAAVSGLRSQPAGSNRRPGHQLGESTRVAGRSRRQPESTSRAAAALVIGRTGQSNARRRIAICPA
jgi:hypothetical protein